MQILFLKFLNGDLLLLLMVIYNSVQTELTVNLSIKKYISVRAFWFNP